MIPPPYGGALRNAAIRPSNRPSVRSFVCANGAFHAYGYYRTPIVNPVLEVEPAGQHGRMDTGSGRRERGISF